MTCEECEVQLTVPLPAGNVPLRRHLEGCAECRQTLEVMEWAALPRANVGEALDFASSTRKAWGRRQGRRKASMGAQGLAVAAMLGGLLLWNGTEPRVTPEVAAVEFDFAVSALFEEGGAVVDEGSPWEVPFTEEEVP
jgi:hypothetical protein